MKANTTLMMPQTAAIEIATRTQVSPSAWNAFETGASFASVASRRASYSTTLRSGSAELS